MIIDYERTYTTAPKALENWQRPEISDIKDPSARADDRPEDQRRRAARIDRGRTSCA